MRLSSRLVLLAIVLNAAAAHADPPPTQAAYCVAALKRRAEPVAERVRRGEDGAETQLLPIVTASFAFIGSAYKQGVRQPQADELVRQAEKSQAGLSVAELTKVQDDCQAEGERIYASATAFERLFVTQAAHKRIDKLRKPAS